MSNNLQLEKQLCFRLYSLNKVMNRLYTPVLKKLGLTYPQYLVMIVLWQSNKAVSVKSLGNKLDLDSGTLSPLLKRMEILKFLNRERSEADERCVQIKLTESGKKLKHTAQNIPEKIFAITGLTPEKLIELSQQLDELLINLSD